MVYIGIQRLYPIILTNIIYYSLLLAYKIHITLYTSCIYDWKIPCELAVCFLLRKWP